MEILQKYYSSVIGLLRVKTYVLLGLFFIVGYSYALFQTPINSTQFSLRLIVGLIIIAAWYINGTSLNDYADYEIDLINLEKSKERPLLDETLSKNELLIISVIAAIIAVGLSFFISSSMAFLTVFFVSLNAAYSLKPLAISHRGALAIAMLPLGYVFFPVTTAVWVAKAKFDPSVLVLITALYFQFISRIILKDFRDVKGDAKFGKKTFLLRYGARVTCLTSQIALFLGTSLLIAFFFKQLIYTAFGALLLAGYSYEMLNSLKHQKTWKSQKGYISSFGRAQTGILVQVGLCFYLLSLGLYYTNIVLVCSLAGAIFLYSSALTYKLSSSIK